MALVDSKKFSDKLEAPRVSRAICVLGPPGIENPDFQPLKHHKIAVLLTYLAVHRSASRERLTGLLWPELTQQKASTNLRGALHKLKTLAPGAIEKDGDQISLCLSWEVDLNLLTQAKSHRERRRAARYQGTLCEGIVLPDCDELEQWLSQLREDTHCAVVSNLIELSKQWADIGQLDQAVEAARSAVSIEPHSELAHGQLIETLVASADFSAAKRQFERLKEVLAEEFGSEPSAETAKLLERRPRGQGPRSNVPSALSSFLGRSLELDWIHMALEEHRCVTITGMGGVGKTELCLEACRRLAETEPPAEGIWYVRQAPLVDGSLLREVFEQTVALPSKGGRFWDNLKDAHCLLFVDNCEHLLEPAAELLRELLETCPKVRVLTTSREALKLPGETVLCLEPLPIPESAEDLAALLESPSIQLLLERGRAVAPELSISEENASAFLEICQGLDGIPLALELAGARLGMLSPEQLALRLSDRFRLLKGRPGDESRQKTLGALLDWSYETLEPELKELFASLSVFAGNFDLSAVEDICLPHESDWEALERLSALVEKSLVTVVASGRVKRYKLLETVKQYARAYLTKDDLDRLMNAHLEYYLKIARRAEAGLSGNEQKRWVVRLDAELPNIRAAVRRAEGRSHRIAGALELCLAPVRYWQIRDLRTAVRKLLPIVLNEALAIETDSVLIIRAQRLLGEFATDQGDLEEGRLRIEESLCLAVRVGDKVGQAHAHKAMGNLDYCIGQFVAAKSSYGLALKLFLEYGDQEGATACHNNLGLVAFEVGDYGEAQVKLSQSLEQARATQDHRSVALSLTNLGHLALKQGKDLEAQSSFAEALRLYRQLHEYWNPTLQTLKGLAQLCLAREEWEKAAQFLVLARKVIRRTRITEFVSTRASMAELEKRLAEKVGEKLFETYSAQYQAQEFDELFETLGF